MGSVVGRGIPPSPLLIFSSQKKPKESEPTPPPPRPATTISEKTQVAMGAWIIGSSMPKSLRMRSFGHIFTASVMLTTTSPSALRHQDAQFRRLQTQQIRDKAASRQLLQLWLSASEGSIALASHVHLPDSSVCQRPLAQSR